MGRGGNAEHAASILGGGYCSPHARHVVVFFDFLARPFYRFCPWSVRPHPRGAREGRCPPRRCNIAQVGNPWLENGFLKVLGGACGTMLSE